MKAPLQAQGAAVGLLFLGAIGKIGSDMTVDQASCKLAGTTLLHDQSWTQLNIAVEQCNINAVGFVSCVITLFTGSWFIYRQNYTQERAATRPRALSHLFSLFIGVAGLGCYGLAAFPLWLWLWPWLHALVLTLGIEKDAEIIWANRRRELEKIKNVAVRARKRLLGAHHIYSILRDASLAFWWVIYGWLYNSISLTREEHLLVVLAFGIPYILLVISWMVLKGIVENAEDEFDEAVKS